IYAYGGETDAAWKVLGTYGSCLCRNTSLKKASFTYRTIPGVSRDDELRGLVVGFAAARSTTHVELYDFAEGSVESKLAYSFAAMLPYTKGMEKIRYSTYLNISAPATTQIAKALRKDECRVKKLDVIVRGTIQGWSKIVSAMVANPHIQDFCLTGGLLGYGSLIEEALKGMCTNQSLRRLRITAKEDSEEGPSLCQTEFSDDLFQSVKGSYSIEDMHLPGFSTVHQPTVLKCLMICTLNEAGRKYMIEDNSIQNGLDCLGRLSNANHANSSPVIPNYHPELDCLFYHLRENAATFFGGGPPDALAIEIQSEQLRFQSFTGKAEFFAGEAKKSRERITTLVRKQQSTLRKRKHSAVQTGTG
ncbi:MAG: hypothetical protein SGARI_002131, partial [Bacillariaceae sp.]